MKNKDFTVRVTVSKVYDVRVYTFSRDAAVRAALNMQSTEIEENGNLVNVETGYAEVVDEEEAD